MNDTTHRAPTAAPRPTSEDSLHVPDTSMLPGTETAWRTRVDEVDTSTASLRNTVRSHPLSALGAAFGLGALLARVLR